MPCTRQAEGDGDALGDQCGERRDSHTLQKVDQEQEASVGVAGALALRTEVLRFEKRALLAGGGDGVVKGPGTIPAGTQLLIKTLPLVLVFEEVR